MRSFARLVLLALLAFAVAAGPALSFAAEAHETVGHPGEHGSDHEHAGETEADGGVRMLHVVTQLGTCCGHACALLPAAWSPPPHALPVPPHVRVETLAPGRANENPLRPPIAV